MLKKVKGSLELPERRNADITVVGAAVVADAEARRGDAPNDQFLAIGLLLATCVSPKPIDKQTLFSFS